MIGSTAIYKTDYNILLLMTVSLIIKCDLWSTIKFNLTAKLFTLYINNIYNTSKLFKLILFADDTNIVCSGNDPI